MKNLFQKFLRFCRNPKPYVEYLLIIWLSPLFPDRLYMKILSKIRCGYRCDLEHPKTFNEKLNWIKLNDRKPIYTKMADKLTAKEFAAQRIGQDYIVPLYGSWERVEDIDFDKLPNQFVLKCSHSSGDVVICKDKAVFDIETARKRITKFMKH